MNSRTKGLFLYAARGVKDTLCFQGIGTEFGPYVSAFFGIAWVNPHFFIYKSIFLLYNPM